MSLLVVLSPFSFVHLCSFLFCCASLSLYSTYLCAKNQNTNNDTTNKNNGNNDNNSSKKKNNDNKNNNDDKTDNINITDEPNNQNDEPKTNPTTPTTPTTPTLTKPKTPTTAFLLVLCCDMAYYAFLGFFPLSFSLSIFLLTSPSFFLPPSSSPSPGTLLDMELTYLFEELFSSSENRFSFFAQLDFYSSIFTVGFQYFWSRQTFFSLSMTGIDSLLLFIVLLLFARLFIFLFILEVLLLSPGVTLLATLVPAFFETPFSFSVCYVIRYEEEKREKRPGVKRNSFIL